MQQIKSLVKQGIITPNTMMETDSGHQGLAGQIPGLFAAPSPSVPQSPFEPTNQDIIDNGAELDAKNNNEKTPLDLAQEKENKEMVGYLTAVAGRNKGK